jgi:hypothetical protein
MAILPIAYNRSLSVLPVWRTRLLTALAAAALVGVLLLATTHTASAQGLPPDAIPPGQAALRINEFMASNGSFEIDPAQPEKTPDWIEIYNPGAAPVDLKGLSLSDDPLRPDKSPITGSAIVPAGGFLLMFEGEDAAGQPLSPVHFTFGISAAGESVGLYVTATGEKVDEYTFGAQTQNVSEGREPDGGATWRTFSVPTPGETNGKNAPVIVSVTRNIVQPQAADSVVVTAVITDNQSIVSATLVYTVGTTANALPMSSLGSNGWSATIPPFPNNTFVAYQVRAVDDEANATRSRVGGYVVGYVAPLLRINEFMAENFGLVEDEDDPGEFPDWMELHNPTAAAIALDGLYLSDDPLDPTQFPIPTGLSVPANGFLIFWLDGDAGKNQGPTHTNFSLNKDGDFLALFGAQGTVQIDGLVFGKQTDNVSMGRFPDGAGSANSAVAFKFLACTTAGKPNLLCENKNYMPTVRGPDVPEP